MALEVATFISQLVSSNPTAGDSKSQGDDHLRMMKASFQATFPGADHAIYFPVANSKNVSGTINSTEDNSVATVDTGGGAVTLTLPNTLTGANFWKITIVKFTADSNPVFVVPPSGSIDGFAKIRLNVPGEAVTFVWFGSFFARILPAGILPAGTYIENASPNIPVGYLAPLAQSLVAADYPELFSALGYTYGGSGANFSLPNGVGTILAQRDSASSRLDVANLGVDPNVVGVIGGSKSHTLTTAQLAAHIHANTIDNPTHDHGVTSASVGIQSGDNGTGVAGKPVFGGSTAVSVDITPAAPGLTLTNVSEGGGTAHPNIQPTMIVNRILRAC